MYSVLWIMFPYIPSAYRRMFDAPNAPEAAWCQRTKNTKLPDASLPLREELDGCDGWGCCITGIEKKYTVWNWYEFVVSWFYWTYGQQRKSCRGPIVPGWWQWLIIPMDEWIFKKRARLMMWWSRVRMLVRYMWRLDGGVWYLMQYSDNMYSPLNMLGWAEMKRWDEVSRLWFHSWHMLSYVDLKHFFVVHMHGPSTQQVAMSLFFYMCFPMFFPLFWRCAICRSTVVLFFLIGVSDGYIAIYTPVI